MTLFDIDKSGDGRSDPKPNENDQQNQRLAQGTTQNQNSVEEAQADGLKFLERQIIAKQDGVNKAVFGFLDSSNKFGLRVAKEGQDVLTASSDGLVFNSEQNTFKIVTTTVLTLPVDFTAHVGSGTETAGPAQYVHGLGYAPAVLVYQTNGTSYFPVTNGSLFSVKLDTLGSQIIQTLVTINSTVVSVSMSNKWNTGVNSSDIISGDYMFKIYVLQETAS